MNGKTLLLVEDDMELAEMTIQYLQSEGFELHHCADGRLAVDMVRTVQPDAVVLDIMLPGLNGIEVCRQLRSFYQQPILMLTANDDDMVEVTSLNTGANGYLTKPVRPHVLLAHVHAHLRSGSIAGPAGVCAVQDIIIDSAALTASIAGTDLALTSSEFKLLSYLCDNAGQIIPRDQLFEAIRGIPFDGMDRSIDMQISVLRKKMSDEKAPYKYIKTVRAKGYMLAIR